MIMIKILSKPIGLKISNVCLIQHTFKLNIKRVKFIKSLTKRIRLSQLRRFQIQLFANLFPKKKFLATYASFYTQLVVFFNNFPVKNRLLKQSFFRPKLFFDIYKIFHREKSTDE